MHKCIKLSPVCAACIDGARAIKLDGNCLLINFPGQQSYAPLLSYDTDFEADLDFDMLVTKTCSGLSDPGKRAAWNSPGYMRCNDLLLSVDGIYLTIADVATSSVTVQYRDGFFETIVFDDPEAALAGLDSISAAIAGMLGNEPILISRDGKWEVLSCSTN